MNRTAIAASPSSYFETLRPSRAAEASAFGTGLSAEVFRDVHKRRPVRNRLIAEHLARHSRAGIGGRLAIRRLEPTARHIANAYQSEGAGDLRCLRVEKILTAIGDLGMDGLHTASLAGSLCFRKRHLVLGEHAGVLDLIAGRERHAFLQPKVDSDFGILSVRLWLVLNNEVAVPATTGVLRERPGLFSRRSLGAARAEPCGH